MNKHMLFTCCIHVAILFATTGCVKLNCPLPVELDKTVKQEPLSSASAAADVKRNSWSMDGLCADRITFYENGRKWRMLLVRNIKNPTGPFWYLPHDNENSALDAAVYAVKKFGGGFLAVEANGNRYASGKDPNRNFKPASSYTRTVFKVIDAFKSPSMPYLALHSNRNGHQNNGGEGMVSMRVAGTHTKSYPAGSIAVGKKEGLHDEDSLVYLAGRSLDTKKIAALNAEGLNVKYELVGSRADDHSMSNYIALHRSRNGYVNIEAEDGDTSTQKKMIDRVIKLVYQGVL
ncbi:hypothetical protein [Sulfurovum sp. NBC37-1]|uniref:hypothetical protein n=1 Tax=Sulfurovum sp. (strain NBC37-1) TaxID=387093 RepID=UPI000158763C|nr:hypothetical protein [Sulfurovum sp. NBC37-1]BAF71863.1 hypothetical protein SUN_0905 [Sulfurovum sp. NBC37-1]